jgi:F-type H+-transporting ATPase subunit b
MIVMNRLQQKSQTRFRVAILIVIALCTCLSRPLHATTPLIPGDDPKTAYAAPEDPGEAGHGDAVHQLFDPKSIVWTVLSFLIVLAALRKFVFPALDEAMQKREAAMRGSIEEAKRAREEAQQLLKEYEERLSQARQEAQAILEESRVMAEQVRKDLVAKTQEEAAQMISRAQDEIQQAKARGIAELKKTVGELSLRLASEVVRHDIDEAKHHALINEFLDNIQSLEVSGRGV